MCVQTGSELVAADHYRSEEVRSMVSSLTTDWKKLSSASIVKGVVSSNH